MISWYNTLAVWNIYNSIVFLFGKTRRFLVWTPWPESFSHTTWVLIVSLDSHHDWSYLQSFIQVARAPTKPWIAEQLDIQHGYELFFFWYSVGHISQIHSVCLIFMYMFHVRFIGFHTPDGLNIYLHLHTCTIKDEATVGKYTIHCCWYFKNSKFHLQISKDVFINHPKNPTM